MAPTDTALRKQSGGRIRPDKAPEDQEGARADTGEAQGGQETDHPQGPTPAKSSHVITEFIEVGVPLNEAFRRFTQFDKWSEMFKKESADSAQDDEVTITAKIGPSRRQWKTEWEKDDGGRRIDWHATGGLQAHGTTTFHRLDDRLTRVMAEIDYRPSGAFETVGNFFRMPRRRVRRDLRLFKHYVEIRSTRDDASSTDDGRGRREGQEDRNG